MSTPPYTESDRRAIRAATRAIEQAVEVTDKAMETADRALEIYRKVEERAAERSLRSTVGGKNV